MLDDIMRDADQRMRKTLDALRHEFARIRTGRAHPGLLEQVTMDYYGSQTPLHQTANINVLDARTLGVTPWDKSMVAAIEKAILNADLGLNPATTGDVIRVPLPALTGERRQELTRLVKAEAEKARVAIRNIRRDANHQVKEALKEKLITEDEDRKQEGLVQKMTDARIADIDSILQDKEAELTAV